MKLLSVSLALAACLSMAAAQGLQDLPACARQCATGSIPANCGLSVQCICSDSSFISGISCCIRNTCPPDQQQAAVQFANQICRTAGVTNLPQSPSCPSSTGTSSATTSGSSTNTATNESNTTSQTSTASPTAATATTSTTSTTTSSSASAATTTSKGAAVAQHKDIGLLAAAGAAAAAFGLLA